MPLVNKPLDMMHNYDAVFLPHNHNLETMMNTSIQLHVIHLPQKFCRLSIQKVTVSKLKVKCKKKYIIS